MTSLGSLRMMGRELLGRAPSLTAVPSYLEMKDTPVFLARKSSRLAIEPASIPYYCARLGSLSTSSDNQTKQKGIVDILSPCFFHRKRTLYLSICQGLYWWNIVNRVWYLDFLSTHRNGKASTLLHHSLCLASFLVNLLLFMPSHSHFDSNLTT